MHEIVGDDAAEGADLGRAATALDAVQREPRAAERIAIDLLAVDDLTPVEHAGALWALGRARNEADRPREAVEALDEAIGIAEGHGLLALAAEIRVSRSLCLLTGGDATAARADLEVAEPHLTGPPLGRLLMQRALLDLHAGHLSDALAGFDSALPGLEDGDDRVAVCRLLANRGVVLSYLGENERAEADLVACRELAASLDQHLVVAGATHNLGYLRGRTGDIPGALEWFDRAREAYEVLGMPDRLATSLETDLCSVLLAGGLHVEAIAAAERAERAASAGGNRLAEAEARLLRAQALLAQGAPEAEAVALEAAAVFAQVDRRSWASYAEFVSVQAAAASHTPDVDLLGRASALVGPLESQGWRAEAAEVRILAGRLALAIGDVQRARRLLAEAAKDKERGTARVRADAWLATAHLRLANGDRGGARRALRTGIDVVNAHRASLGATELRTRATRHATDLAALGLGMAVDDARPAELLSWAERWHAGSLALAPVRPPRDGRAAALLAELRAAHEDLRVAALSGAPSDEASRVVTGLEAKIRDVSRTTSGEGTSAPRFDPSELRADLDANDGTTLVEFVIVRGELWAVRVTPRRCTARCLGPPDEVAHDVSLVLAALRRLAVGRASARSIEASMSTLDDVGAALDRRLIAPLALPTSGRVVIVPTSVLQGLPWSVLPSLRERPVTVAPSASVWLRGRANVGTGPDVRRTALVAGPDLVHASREVSEIAALCSEPLVLRDPDATATAVLDAMEGASTVHLAVHGTFRSDNPFFSSLQASDGPLTIYDLELLARAPTTVVLPACDAGVAAVRGGDELIGTAAALLSVGVDSIIAPLTIVPDGSVAEMMVDLHRSLLDGVRPSAALASARSAALGRGSPADVAAAHTMVALGTRVT